MAKLKLDNGFEMELNLKIGYQRFDYGITVRLWKNGKGYLIPEEKTDKCDPIDYKNYRIMDYQYIGGDDFLPQLEKYVSEIQCDNKKHEDNFSCWPEEQICINFSNDNDSDTVKVDFEGNLNEIKFKELGIIDGQFVFQTDKERIIAFYNELVQEYEEERKPVRLYVHSSDCDEKPWPEEKRAISKQKLLEPEKPVVLIDGDIFPSNFSLKEKEKEDFYNFNNELKKNYWIAIIEGYSGKVTKKTFGLKLSEKIGDWLMLGYNCYPKNKEIIYLRSEGSFLSIYCCLDRYITSIRFDDWCRGDWNIALEEVKKCIKNPMPVTNLADLEDEGTCPYRIL